MIVFLNGRFVSEERATVSVFDRSFLYGDGLFETMLVANGRPFRWAQHLDRLTRGAAFLKIKLPLASDRLLRAAERLIAKNKMPDALLRLTLSRGVGPRGYSPRGADRPTLVMSMHPAPRAGQRPRWNLVTSAFRLPADEPLAQFKTCNKLPQILARAGTADADEALLLNTDGFVVEAASSNLFWIERDTVCTPPLASGILAGVTRAVVLEICRSLPVKTRECNVTPTQLRKMDGVFVSLSSLGVVEAKSLDGRALKPCPLVARIQSAFHELVGTET